MPGKCKYCGFVGTNDELADHAGEMCQGDHQPDTVEETLHIKQHTQAKMPSWGDVTKGITFSTVGERDVAAEVFSRVARHFGCA